MTTTKEFTTDYVSHLATQHHWAATGVSDYPPRDPLVGQGRFFKQYQTFIHTVDHGADSFAHVFAVEGEWGRGKSRLGHELIAQINDCSQGWFVRDRTHTLSNATLFDDDEKRDSYLGLYIRYSQVASDYQNANNWFGFGVYKALIPLATRTFDGSIQSGIAQQALRRLEAMGFDSEQLSAAMALEQGYSDETLYEDKNLISRLTNQAFRYLENFGIKHVLVVLDELETVAEAASFGLEQDDAKRLDGQAIRLIGRAIKEEDQRKSLPWLRYVALCSPLLGQQLREIQSTARRFELVELEHNAFADVSDYVSRLKDDRKLQHNYPNGLVEAAYTMSGANFGWFNVIMANVDAFLSQHAMQHAGQATPPTGEIFSALLEGSGRIRDHVLDHNAIGGIQTSDHALLDEARTLLFGQLPVALDQCRPRTHELLDYENEANEPVASLYRKVEWDPLECRRALEAFKFKRDKEEWIYPSVEQSLNLQALLQNLHTFSINETTTETGSKKTSFLIPLAQTEFRRLIDLLYHHSASEFAADALWKQFMGETQALPEEEATHIGPSIAMLSHLNLRYRSQQNNSLIFRTPEDADAHALAVKQWEAALSSQPPLKNMTRLTGLFRLLDKHWLYQPEVYPNRSELAIIQAPRASGRGQTGGLMHCDGLKLHPNNQVWFAWVNNKEELGQLHKEVCSIRERSGRIPVMAFTTSVGVNDFYLNGLSDKALQDDILLYQLNTNEAETFEQIGLSAQFCPTLEFRDNQFTGKFRSRLNSMREYAYQAIHNWRIQLNQRGLIAWPLRPAGKINTQDRERLFKAWKLMAIDEPSLTGLNSLTAEHPVDAEEIRNLMGRLTVSGQNITQGYLKEEHAGLFTHIEHPAHTQAQIPPFLARITHPGKKHQWTLNNAKSQWYWGYLWSASGLNSKNVFEDWMWWAGALHLLEVKDRYAKYACWSEMPRSAFDNAITEADNWLNDHQPEHYRETLKALEMVYGHERIHSLFAPKGSVQEGPHTTNALDALHKARSAFDDLKLTEEKLPATVSLTELGKTMGLTIKARNDILNWVNQVKPRHRSSASHHPDTGSSDNLKTIQLDNKTIPLFDRMTQASQFAHTVKCCEERISSNVLQLIAAIERDPDTAAPFPRRLFTLSLKTITGILEGALKQTSDTETARTEAGGSSETLLHFLRDLNIAKATERLELLGEEVGYNLHTDSTKAFEEINGYILSTLRHFKNRFIEVQGQFSDYEHRLNTLKHQLTPLPCDFPCDTANQDALTQLVELADKLSFIKDGFEEIDDQIDSERSRFAKQARKGQFSAIKEIPERLVKPVQHQLAAFGGHLRTLENQVSGYQNKALAQANGTLLETLNPLFKACNEPIIPSLIAAHIAGQSLHEIAITIKARHQSATKKAEHLLEGTAITLERWASIAQQLNAGQQPGLKEGELDALVKKGILKYQVTFGGG